MVERNIGLVSSPHTCPTEVLVASLWFCVILTVFTAVMIMLNTLPWFWQARSFLVPLRRWENTPGAGLGDEGQVWSLLRRDGRLEGDHSSSLTCCPLAFHLIRVPCNQLTRWTCLPSRHARAGKWNNHEADTWGVSRSPREGEPHRGKEANRHRPV